MNMFRRLRDALGLGEVYEDYYYGDEEVDQSDPNAFPEELEQPTRRRALPSNVIGLPGLMMEVVLMQPRSFEEIPDAVTALRERKAVILNLNLMDVHQAQRCADYVAGGAFAIDGHQRQLSENVFLFTPNFVQISQHSRPEVPQAPPTPYADPFQPPTPQPRQRPEMRMPIDPQREF